MTTTTREKPIKTKKDSNYYAKQALLKKSSLRFDWTNLPPQSPLAREIETSQSRCLNETHVRIYGPQKMISFEPIWSGMGSSLHTWMYRLCEVSLEPNVFRTMGYWMWNDQAACPTEINQKATLTAGADNHKKAQQYKSPFWCYFGWHESGLRCPQGTLNWSAISEIYFYQKCPRFDYHGIKDTMSALAEWLFQNVSELVIREAERQIRKEAFPLDDDNNNNNYTTLPGNVDHYGEAVPFLRWPMPDADSLVTIHIRWGDKAREMKLATTDEIINATKSILTPEELTGRKVVHFYVATEDPSALQQFKQAAAAFPTWKVHSSGPLNPKGGDFPMTYAPGRTKGKVGLQSLAALLVALQANRYVLKTGSNWSRLINELRLSVVDSRCGNCTQMIDLQVPTDYY